MTSYDHKLLSEIRAVLAYYLRHYNPGGFGTFLLERIDEVLRRTS